MRSLILYIVTGGLFLYSVSADRSHRNDSFKDESKNHVKKTSKNADTTTACNYYTVAEKHV